MRFRLPRGGKAVCTSSRGHPSGRSLVGRGVHAQDNRRERLHPAGCRPFAVPLIPASRRSVVQEHEAVGPAPIAPGIDVATIGAEMAQDPVKGIG
jgi:hypothetical protein